MTGTGTVATVHFHALAAGATGLGFFDAIGRDADNHDVPVTTQGTLGVGTRSSVTDLGRPIPNPTRGSSTIAYSLAMRGTVDLSVYSVDGRRVRTLAHGAREAGRYQVQWNGSDNQG